MRPALFTLFFGLLACSSGPTTQPSAAAPPRSQTASPAAAAPAVAASAGEGAPSCESPELWLALYPRDQVTRPYCQACSENCVLGEGGPNMGWKFLTADYLNYGCADLDYARRAIPAYHGVPVTDEPWASYFAGLPWYRPKSSRVELPPAARENAAWLATVVDVCERTYEQGLVRHYKAHIEEWFRRKKGGDIRLPPRLFVDHQPATREWFLKFLSHGGGEQYFQYNLRTPLRADATNSTFRSQFPGVTLISVTAGTSGPSLSCVDNSGIDCEGYEALTFLFDAASGELVGLSATAAG